MDFKTLLARNRSYRRFHEDRALDEQTLAGLVEITRLCPSGANRQPLKYLISYTAQENARIFPHIGWAKWLPDWSGPVEGDRPTGYIVILGDRQISEHFDYDAGIAASSILLAATEQGLGGCMIAWLDREELARKLNIPDQFDILLVLALGQPKEAVVLEDIDSPGDFGYWRDPDGVHHVPKRRLDELLVRFEQPAATGEPALA